MHPNLFSRKLLPAVTVTDADEALFVAEALLKGGLDIMEITFRTTAAAAAIEAVATSLPEMCVGAGTLLEAGQIREAIDAGAEFGLAPGFNDRVVTAAAHHEFLFIPGVTTPSEIEMALARGIQLLKLFPADALGGVSYMKQITSPYQHTGLKLIPMGGVNLDNLAAYLRHPIVLVPGGSWLAPADLIRKREFNKIVTIVKHSMQHVRERVATSSASES